MAISSTSSVPSLNRGVFAQIQQQQAQRNADQAEQQARFLQIEAQRAQSVSTQAQENARSLKVQANQAQGDASRAQQGLSAMKSLGDVQTGLDGLHDQISVILKPEPEAGAISAAGSSAGLALPTSLAPVINLLGQATGTLLNVTA